MDIVFRAFFVFVLLYVLMRAIGRRELSTLEPFDLILLVVLGDLVQQGVTQDDYSVTGIMLAIGTIALLQLGVSFVNYKFPKLRPLLDGEPIILVQDGEAARSALDAAGISVADEREAIVVDLHDKPGAMGEIARDLAAAGVNIDVAYTIYTGVRLVILLSLIHI